MVRHHTVLIACLVMAGTLAAAGAAQAYWRSSGSGSGAATTGGTVAVQLSAGTPVVALRPGGQSAVSLVVSNPNASSVRLNSLVLDSARGTSGFTVDAGHASGCSLTGLLTFASQNNGGVGWTIPAAVGPTPGTQSITLANALSMSSAAPTGCQGATFTVYLAVGA